MKHRYLRVLASLVLTLGLCSCNSDKSEELSAPLSDDFGVKKVDFINKDKSIQNINNTKELPIDNSIGLDIEESESKEFILTTKSRCYGGTLRTNYYHDQTWKNVTSIKVTSLVPIEAFQPLQTEDNQIICDFHMEASNSAGSKTTIDLNDIRITNLHGFYDINTMGDDTSETPFLILEDEQDRVLDLPFTKSNVHLLCDNDLNTLIADSSNVNFKLIKEYSFLNKEVNFCRFVFESVDSKERRVGKYFYLQKEASKISIEMISNFPEASHHPTEISIDFNNKALAYLNIHNQGKTKVYIDLQKLDHSKIEILGYYSSGGNSNLAYHYSAVSRTIKWIANNGNIIQTNGKLYLEILPGEKGQLKAITSGKLLCGIGQHAPVSVNECQNRIQYHGYLINFQGMPTLSINRKESLKDLNWASYSTDSTLPEESYFKNNYQFWKGNPVVYDICKPYTKIDPKFPSKVTEIFVSNSNLHSCEFN